MGLAVAFGLWIWYHSGTQYAGEFFAGWLTEYSLSVDNLFVFLLIMRKFLVPEKLQQEALVIGIVIAIILRGIFIALGAAVINEFASVFYLFGLFLIYTAVKLAREGSTVDDEFEENRFLKWVERRFPVTPEFHGPKNRDPDRRQEDAHADVHRHGLWARRTCSSPSTPSRRSTACHEGHTVLTANIFAVMACGSSTSSSAGCWSVWSTSASASRCCSRSSA